MSENAFECVDAVLVDADDTLWENNIYFLQAIDWLLRMGRRCGYTDRAVTDRMNQYELRNIRQYGYGYDSFERSFLAMVHWITRNPYGEKEYLHAGLRIRAKQWVAFVRRHPIVLLPGVEETLPHLAKHIKTIIVTKGNQHDQMAKVYRSGLLPFFHGVEVVPHKYPENYAAVLEKYDLAPDNVVMIGNSPASDINNPKRLGIRTVFIPHRQTWTFEHEPIRPDGPGTIEIPKFSALTEVLALPIA
jgi:putative hydrolase of the HAD superfamily